MFRGLRNVEACFAIPFSRKSCFSFFCAFLPLTALGRFSRSFVDFSPHMQRLLWQMQTTLEPPLAQGSSSVLAVLVFGSTPSMRGLFVYLLPIERPLPMQGKSRPNWASFFLTLEPTLRKQRKGVIRRKRHLFLRANPAYGEFRTQ